MIYAAYKHTGKQLKVYLSDTEKDLPADATQAKAPQHLENAIRKALGEGVTSPNKTEATKVLFYLNRQNALMRSVEAVLASFATGVDPTIEISSL